ncbi:Glycosyl transferase family 4 [Musa troglodytarum]|uniref:Glycosyl transferase family 4 n=1 Tax=Musa troglodytarum TaxID=320322 RepID=A0A9E7K4V1_9LILI|nr:Glycosyl transferase family 4 [Musa troglodytarum]
MGAVHSLQCGYLPSSSVLSTRDPAEGTVQGNEVLACRGSSPCPAEARPHPPCCRAFCLPFFYLVFFHYRIEHDLRRLIVINAAMSFGAFVAAVRIIPVAARYVLRRSLFTFDISKKDTQGAIEVKLVLPSFAALPLLMAYVGHATISIPKPLIDMLEQLFWI